MKDYQLKALATAISSKKTTEHLLAHGINLGILEGGIRHKAISKQLALYLKRNLNAGERRRLCWLCNGNTYQANTVGLTANITNKALARVPSNTDIRASKAIKNIA